MYSSASYQSEYQLSGVDVDPATKSESSMLNAMATGHAQGHSHSHSYIGRSTGASAASLASAASNAYTDDHADTPRRSPLGIDRSANDRMVREWLLENKFDIQTANALSGYSAMELFDISKDDLKALVGTKDGIRLYTKLKQMKEILGSELSPQEAHQVRCQAAALIGSSPTRSVHTRTTVGYGSMHSYDHETDSSRGFSAAAGASDDPLDEPYIPMTPQIAASQGVSTVFRMPYTFMPDLTLNPSPSPGSTCSEGTTPRHSRTNSHMRHSNATASRLLPGGRRGVGSCCMPLCGKRVFTRCCAAECGQSMCLDHAFKEIITGYVYCPECYEVYAPLNIASRKIKSTCNIQ